MTRRNGGKTGIVICGSEFANWVYVRVFGEIEHWNLANCTLLSCDQIPFEHSESEVKEGGMVSVVDERRKG